MAAESSSAAPVPGWRRAARAVLAVGLHALLLDAAIETLLGDWPLRWWFGGALLACVVVSAWLMLRRWRAGDAGAGTGTALAALLAAIAASAWMPDGLQNGVRLLGQQTSTITTIAATVGVGLACVALFTVTGRWWWARAGLVALGAYATAALVMGAVARTPFAGLLGGQSLWQRLPLFLQGAFVGAVVLVPFGLVALVVAAVLGAGGHKGLGPGRLAQAIAMLAAVAVTMAVFGAPTQRAHGTSATAGALSIPAADDRAARGRVPEIPTPGPVETTPGELTSRAEEILTKVPVNRYDLFGRAAGLGPGVEPSFAFVRDAIRYESYQGLLRGVNGTFIVGAGNSFDRSLLLTWLLRRKGVQTRYVMGRLGREPAERLFDRLFDPAAVGPRLEIRHLEKAPAAMGFYTRLSARARRDYLAIRRAVGGATPTGTATSPEMVLQEIQNHVWVQAHVSDQWVDLDTAFPDASPGRSYGTVSRTLDELPDESHQFVSTRIVVETLAGGQLKRDAVLDVRLPFDQLIDRQVVLLHVPDAAQVITGTFGRVLGSPTGTGLTPVLWVDGEAHSGRPVVFDDGQSEGNTLKGFFGGASPSGPAFVAEWLEFEIQFPDGHRETTRRVLADRAGQAWRRSGRLDASGLRPLPKNAQGIIAPRQLHNIWFSAGGHDLGSYAEAVNLFAQSVYSPDHAAPQQPSTFAERIWPVALSNFSLLIWSDHVAVPSLHDVPDVRFYADSPRIWIFTVGPSSLGEGFLETEVDLRRDALRGLGRTPSSDAAVAERKIWFGALEAALEHEAVAEQITAMGIDPASVVSTSSLSASGDFRLIRAGNVAAVDALSASPEAKAYLAAASEDGKLLVVPRETQTGEVGWWEIGAGGEMRAVLAGTVNGVKPRPWKPAGGSIDWSHDLPKPKGPSGSGTVTIDPKQYPGQFDPDGNLRPWPKGGGGKPPGPPPRPTNRLTPRGRGSGAGGQEMGEYIDTGVVAEEAAPSFVKLGVAYALAMASTLAAVDQALQLAFGH